MTPGKYVGHKFTKDQKRARTIYRRAEKELLTIGDALMVIPIVSDRKKLHARLDRRLDVIERKYTKARELFPDVSESFTIASMTMKL